MADASRASRSSSRLTTSGGSTTAGAGPFTRFSFLGFGSSLEAPCPRATRAAGALLMGSRSSARHRGWWARAPRQNLALLRARGAQLISLGRLGERASVTTVAPPPATPFPSPAFLGMVALVAGGVTVAFVGLGGAPWPVEASQLEIKFAHALWRLWALPHYSPGPHGSHAQVLRSEDTPRL